MSKLQKIIDTGEASFKEPWRAENVPGAGWQIKALITVWEKPEVLLSFFRVPRWEDISFRLNRKGELNAMIAYEEWTQFAPDDYEARLNASAELMGRAHEMPQMAEALLAAREALDEINSNVNGWEWVPERREVQGIARKAIARIDALDKE